MPPLPGAVVFAKNLPRVTRYYSEVMGLNLEHEDASHAVLRGGGIELVIHAIPPAIAAGIEIEDPPERRTDTAFKLFFAVPSIAQARQRAADTGGTIDAPGREWTARGFRACDGCDPEGNVVQVREAAR